MQGGDARTDTFHHWLRLLLFRLLTRLASLEGAPDAVWTSALCTLAHLTTHRGRTVRAYVEDLPLCALGALLDHARDGAWAPAIRDWLLTLACNLLYVRGEGGRGAGSRSLKSPSATESLRSSSEGFFFDWGSGGVGGAMVGKTRPVVTTRFKPPAVRMLHADV